MSVPVTSSERFESSNALVPGDLARQVEQHREEGWVNLDPALRMFAIEYMNHLDHCKTAVELGWDSSRGTRLMKHPLVRAMIADLMAEAEQFHIQTRHFVREKLMEMLPKLAGEEDVAIVLGNGVPIQEKKFFPGEYRATLEALARMGGFEKPVEEAKRAPEIHLNFGDVCSGDVNVQVNMEK